MPSNLLLTFYGDDFTGSTDAMEALAIHGVPTVLFFGPPTTEQLARFPEARAIGIAGISRMQTPAWMSAHLPEAYRALQACQAPLCHYKVCSTFDSSPQSGNIGRAIEIGREVFQTQCVPMVVGAPVLRRYVVFGNLFATADGTTFRIDRHPTMSRHPVTPMDEGDLRRHLARQTDLRTGLVDLLALHRGDGWQTYKQCKKDGAQIVLLDTFDEASLREAGRILWEQREQGTSFVAGSSGVEYALLAWWRELGMLPPKPILPAVGKCDPLLVLSGSCSPGTERQIRWALDNGFHGIRLDTAKLSRGEVEPYLQQASQSLDQGQSTVLYSALGPDSVSREPLQAPDFGLTLGQQLGKIAATLVHKHRSQRLLVAGGDTSGHIGKALGIEALTVLLPFAPGSPLCRAWSSDPLVDGLQILLKGGQVGGESLFGQVRDGQPEPK